MLARLASLRLRLLGALLATAAVGLACAYLAIGQILNSNESASDRRQARRTAQTIAARVRAGANPQFLPIAQAVLHDVQLIVVRNGRTVFAGRALRGVPLETTVSEPVPGGRVMVRKYELSPPSEPIEVTLVAGGVSALVILSALVITALLIRGVRGPIERAVAAADRVAAGDLSARMGGGGPEEFDRLSDAFDDMAARLEQADLEQRRFLADVAHEIATPVGAIANLAGALADGTATSEADRAEAGVLLAAETARVRALLEDLRQLTRLDIAAPTRFEQVDLGALCHRLAARFERPARDAGLRLQVRADPLSAISNERLLDTVVSNLVSNAVRYTPAGGTVTLQATRRNGQIAISVSDTGIGIAPEHRHRVFDRLYRIDSDRGRATGGSGLGLAIVRRGTHALDAKISLESQPGQGSTFTLLLPQPTLTPAGATPRARDDAEQLPSNVMDGPARTDETGTLI